MMTLKIMKETGATNTNKFGCDFCGRSFLRETTIEKHLCEYKQRWLNKDLVSNRIAFQAWLDFYNKNTNNTKKKTYNDFIKSAYYTAFVKFATYCVDTRVININRYIDYLLENQIKIDTWNTDTVYTRFLIEYLRIEDPYDAISRSIETAVEISTLEKIRTCDILRYANKNRICYNITTGRISPWMLYHSESGNKFLDNLDNTQVKMIIDYINPELWNIKFKRDPSVVAEIKKLLSMAGY